jgi:deoxyribose-phosphate aldolase
MSADARLPRSEALRILSLLDLTSLGEQDTPPKIESLCASALAAPVHPAAVCVYPEHVTTARRSLRGTPVRIATVVNFPDGGEDAARVERETQRALAAGADEIDLVLPYRALLRGEPALAAAVVRSGRAACGAAVILKLILETGELRSAERIREACAIGIDAGADFLKTSTGKVPVNATPQAAALMLEAIAAAGGKCGLKVAGGIRTLADAIAYRNLAEARLGADWADAAHFRIGASALLAEITAALSAGHAGGSDRHSAGGAA